MSSLVISLTNAYTNLVLSDSTRKGMQLPFFIRKKASVDRLLMAVVAGSALLLAFSTHLALEFVKTQNKLVLLILVLTLGTASYFLARIIMRVHQNSLLDNIHDELYGRIMVEGPFQRSFRADSTDYSIVYYSPHNIVASETTKDGDEMLVIKVANKNVSTKRLDFTSQSELQSGTPAKQREAQAKDVGRLSKTDAIRRLYDIVQLTPVS